MQETQVQSLSGEDLLEQKMAAHSTILAGKKNLMDRGAWLATVHRVSKSQTRLSTHA